MATSQLEPDPEAIIDHHMQYGHGPSTEAELDEKYIRAFPVLQGLNLIN